MKIMSWSNPSKSEAQDAYASSKKSFQNALYQRTQSQRRENQLVSQCASQMRSFADMSSQCLNFERRRDDLEEIIRMLESNVVPPAIEDANGAAKTSAETYEDCIKCDGKAPADLATVFKTKGVQDDANSSEALRLYKQALEQLKQQIEQTKQQIAATEAAIASLSGQIAACNAQQAACTAQMGAAAFNMGHYSKFI